MHLYTNSLGKAVSTHSYSGGSAFRFCPRKYQLVRLNGWKEKKNGAAKEFGKCVESAIQAFHENECKPGWGVDEFKRFWLQQKDKPLDYTDKEGSWEDLYTMGADFLKLYELKWKTFGYTSPKFQVSFRKEVFPGSEYAGLDYVAYVDLLGKTSKGHVIIDIKTGAAALDETPGMLQLDPQLRRYAWVSGIPNVAFLQFIKTRPGFKKGDEVTVTGGPRVGQERVVLGAKGDEDEGAVFTITAEEFAAYKEESKGLRGKAADQVLQQYEGKSYFDDPSNLTKQRLQFLTASVSTEDIAETGQVVGREIVEIVAANKQDYWPQAPGIRFPDNKCGWCSMRGLCLNNKQLTEDLLVKPDGDDWVAELEKE